MLAEVITMNSVEWDMVTIGFFLGWFLRGYVQTFLEKIKSKEV